MVNQEKSKNPTTHEESYHNVNDLIASIAELETWGEINVIFEEGEPGSEDCTDDVETTSEEGYRKQGSQLGEAERIVLWTTVWTHGAVTTYAIVSGDHKLLMAILGIGGLTLIRFVKRTRKHSRPGGRNDGGSSQTGGLGGAQTGSSSRIKAGIGTG